MTSTADSSAPPIAATLRPLLARQLSSLRGRFLGHGLFQVALALAGAVALFFALDRWLGLPLPIRLLHTGALVALFGFGMLRWVRYPMQRPFSDLDLAVWFERTFPELHQRLVSALQLGQVAASDLRNQSPAMIDRLLAETAATVQQLPLHQLFDPRPTRKFGLAATAATLLLVIGAISSPATARAFLLRHLGFAASYPRDTTLRLELPPAGPELQRTDSDGLTELVLPAGADLHVSVAVEGAVPKEVLLDVQPLRGEERGEARSITMAPRPGERFRHVFRRLAGSFEFHARGGDDDQGDRRVIVRTVHPPQVASLQARITPPAYTGTGPLEQKGGAIEALVGSDAELTVATTAAVRSAVMVFLESGRRLPLAPTAMQDDSAASVRWSGKFPIEASDRYQIELLADNGLRNPNPGTYPIAALQDYAPVGRWLLPEDEGLALLPTALLCVRVDAHDDFGLRELELSIERGGASVAQRALLPTAAPDAPPKLAFVVTELLEVKDLLTGPAAPAQSQDGLVLQLRLLDNKQPQAGKTELPRRIVQIVDAPQLAATIGRLFRGLREETEQALAVQTDRRARLDELVRPGDAASGDVAQILTGVEVGQGRVASAAERIHRGLMRAFDLHLWNRLEPSQHAAQVIDLYRQHAARLTEPLSLDPAFYRDLASRRAAGSLGALEQTLDPILAMITLADQIITTEAPALARNITELLVANDNATRGPLLQQALQRQQRIQTGLQQLLDRLQDWNDYQDLVQEVRALRDRQRDLHNRTEDARGKK